MPGAINEDPRRSRRRIWALGALAVAVLAVGLVVPWASARSERAGVQRWAVAAIRRAGGVVEYDYQATSDLAEFGQTPRLNPPGPAWLRGLIGPEYFQEVRGVTLREPATVEQLAALSSFDHLATLQVRVPSTSAAALARLPRFASLRSIRLNGLGVTDDALANLCRAGGIRHVLLYETSLTDGGIGALARLGELRSLDLMRQPGLTDAGIARLIEALPPLRRLRLTDIPAGDASVAPLARWGSLEFLNLHGTRITDAATESIADCRELTSLDLGLTGVTDAGIARLRGLARLVSLNLEGAAITDAGLAGLAGLEELESLDLGRTGITDAGLASLAKMGRLERLFLPAMITDAGLDRLAGMTSLRYLSLPGAQITDASLAKLRSLTRLSYLLVAETPVTPEGIAALRKSLPSLLRVIHESVPRPQMGRSLSAVRPD